MSFLRRNWRISPKLSAITAIEKGIILISVPKIQKKSQKTSDGLDNFHAGDCS